jgi:hypothetical protein
MRILLVHHALLSHVSLDGDEAGSQTLTLARLLQAAGHEPRIFAVADERPTPGIPHLPFPPPGFSSAAGASREFGDLSIAELDTYRQVLRKRLDQEVHDFNPHVIHCQHVWILGHLALETGAPYVLTAHSAELEAMVRDPRYARFAHQAAENAGRILAAHQQLADRVADVFPESRDRIQVVDATATDEIVDVYRSAMRERGVSL